MKKFSSLLILMLLFSFMLLPSCEKPEETEPEKDPNKNYLHGKSICGTIASSLVVKTDGKIHGGLFTPQYSPDNIKSVAGGGKHVTVLKEDGSVWTWGYNDYGQLGDGTDTASNFSPVRVKDLDNCIAISAGSAHTLALRIDGTVWAWGDNQTGQLGDSTLITKNYPVKVKGISGVIAISAGGQHSLALKSDGTVWGWGRCTFGNLGNASITEEIAPIQINGLSGITAIAGGTWFTLALKNDGTVWGCGYNAIGQLGNGTTVNAEAPVQALIQDVIAIAAGNSYAMAIRSDSTVWTWGDNSYGNLGDGTTKIRNSPVQAKYLQRIKAISCRWNYYSLAIENDGTIWSWGSHTYLSNRTTPDRVEIP